MTAAIIRDAAVKRLSEVREKSISALRFCKYMPATGTDKGMIQPQSCEEIALKANEANAWIEAMDGAIEILNQEFRKLTEPEQKPAAVTPIKNKRMY